MIKIIEELSQPDENVHVFRGNSNGDEVMIKEYAIKNMREKEKQRMKREVLKLSIYFI